MFHHRHSHCGGGRAHTILISIMFSEKTVSLTKAGVVGRGPTRGHGIPAAVKTERRPNCTQIKGSGWMEGNMGLVNWRGGGGETRGL
jgi:hypothetical protein